MTRIWVPLDVATVDRADAIVGRLSPHRHFKVGLELFAAAGPDPVRRWVAQGLEIFLDLKLHDIPQTVHRATARVRELGVSLLTIHTAGGGPMMAAAREAAGDGLDLAGVTVLTSLGGAELGRLGVPSAEEWAIRLAGLARDAGLTTLVCAAGEAARLRASWPAVRLVVPGIRPTGAEAGDQARTATPFEAVRAGADDLVVGRPILQADNPAEAMRAIREEAARGLAARA